MTVVFLDYSEESAASTLWQELERVVSVKRYHHTSLPELLERGRSADILVTTQLPLRREVLDYMTRPQHILVPLDRMSQMVELQIAAQLGIAVHGIPADPRDSEPFLGAVAREIHVIAGSLTTE